MCKKLEHLCITGCPYKHNEKSPMLSSESVSWRHRFIASWTAKAFWEHGIQLQTVSIVLRKAEHYVDEAVSPAWCFRVFSQKYETESRIKVVVNVRRIIGDATKEEEAVFKALGMDTVHTLNEHVHQHMGIVPLAGPSKDGIEYDESVVC